MSAASLSADRYARHRSTLTGLGMVLHAAEAADLPAPRIVSSNTQELHVDSDADLKAWADWLDGVTYRPFSTGTTVHHWTCGVMFDVPVTVVWLEDVASEAVSA